MVVVVVVVMVVAGCLLTRKGPCIDQSVIICAFFAIKKVAEPMDQLTDRQTDKSSYRELLTQLTTTVMAIAKLIMVDETSRS